MSVPGIVAAVVVGLVVGTLGRLVIPGRKQVPVWLTLAVGLVAALLGTILSRLVGIDGDGYTLRQLIVQVGLAGVAVALVVGTAGGRTEP
ncbi:MULTISPECIES: GlsB/YeaQ/YmgE family stress response membrane protein [Micromonospora]|uniref:GlsB/YeaQ/YmgE family stress response membrane protein n=1 Tax=Micromonospora antibiotica TaxID=2807623 RepID=A0ABS3V5P7_9ACTN|nr:MULTISPECIES: GlsB/YeaQ/YmgE family stress response membrane protein [Micromonospora]MBO4160946.1 GlsB/YeaQ/YmgE family stress response membrane protein [Micromonospora antibiotica]MBW4701490.1 GlsB/YeaQ/YmgE family stress response membrane protein [Micromonospora sp. RL09-050-HVF-A]